MNTLIISSDWQCMFCKSPVATNFTRRSTPQKELYVKISQPHGCVIFSGMWVVSTTILAMSHIEEIIQEKKHPLKIKYSEES